MDTLALAVIAVGVVAAIGVVLVAMTGGNSESDAAVAPTNAAKSQTQPPRTRPRPRRRQQPAIPASVVPLAAHHGDTPSAHDPLVAGFMQVVSSELDNLREQQAKIDQRLKLINGIAELMHDVQGTSPNGTSQMPPRSNSRTVSRG